MNPIPKTESLHSPDGKFGALHRHRTRGSMAESETSIDSLPEDCLSRVISFTSPRDACRSSLASAAFRGAAESDLAWEQFIPPDCLAIAAAADVPVEFASRKELFRKLSAAPLLVDGGTKVKILSLCAYISETFFFK